VTRHDADKVPARKPGDGKLKVIEDAPGSYVKVKTADAAPEASDKGKRA